MNEDGELEAARLEVARLRQALTGVGQEARNAMAGIRGYYSAMQSIVWQVEDGLQ